MHLRKNRDETFEKSFGMFSIIMESVEIGLDVLLKICDIPTLL